MSNNDWRKSLVAEGFDGIETGGASGGVESSDEAHDDGESDGAQRQPPGNIRDFHAGQILPVQVDRCSPSERAPDQPSERDTEESAEEPHGSGFRKEKA